MKREKLIVRVLILLVLLFLGLTVTGSYGLLQPFFILIAGWVAFLLRVAPQVTISWSGIGMVVLCSALVIGGMQWLCQWLHAHWVRQGSADANTSWRWTWTASLYGGVWLLFLAAMGVTGVVHQAGWLAASKEPFYVERHSRYLWGAYMRGAELDLRMAGDDAEWNLAETRRAFEATGRADSRTPSAPEELHALYLEGPSNKLAAVILFYRDPKKMAQAGFMLITPDNTREEFKMDELQAVLARYQR